MSIQTPIDSPIEQRNTGKGNPNAILQFERPLNNRQTMLLDLLPGFDSRATVRKKDVNMRDLAALTAYTGNEYAVFTKGGERLVIRGDAYHVEITTEMADELAKAGYRWSGHTHPGIDFLSTQPSDGDYAILGSFKQYRTVIYNASGQMRLVDRRDME